jgi:hypothetical protein
MLPMGWMDLNKVDLYWWLPEDLEQNRNKLVAPRGSGTHRGSQRIWNNKGKNKGG